MGNHISKVANPQWNTFGPPGRVGNNMTNNCYDYSQGNTIDNSTNNTTYNGSNHYQYSYTTWVAPHALAGRPQPIDILREQVCAGAAFDSAERGQPPRCHPETRTAILSSSSSWVDNLSVVCFFMWITGWAGVGKSAILQTLAEEYQRMRRLAASFFFFEASPDRNTIRGFVATIANQLMDSVPGAAEIILHEIAKNPQIFVNKSFHSQWQTLIVNTLCHPTIPRPTVPMLIVIDGIDEIASRAEQDMLLRTILSTAPQLGSSYKFLFASRPEHQIEVVFWQFNIPQESRIELRNTSSTQADIRLFLQASFSTIRCTHNLQPTSSTEAWPGQYVIECLVNKASGQFVYASTAIQFMESLDDDPQAALDIIMKGRGVGAESFKELDNLYLSMMERIQRSIQKKNQHLLHHLLVCIYMHLIGKVGDDIHLLHPEESNKNLLKNLLRKLDPILGEYGDYQHKSFIEFLVQPSAPHIFAINSWHIAGVISLCLPVFLENLISSHLLCFLEWASPTPDLVSCLAKIPDGKQLGSWSYKAGCKDSGYLWDNKEAFGWLGYRFGYGGRYHIYLDVNRNPLQDSQKSIYLSVWEPYYEECTRKETSPEFYMTRTHDLATLDVDRIHVY